VVRCNMGCTHRDGISGVATSAAVNLEAPGRRRSPALGYARVQVELRCHLAMHRCIVTAAHRWFVVTGAAVTDDCDQTDPTIACRADASHTRRRTPHAVRIRQLPRHRRSSGQGGTLRPSRGPWNVHYTVPLYRAVAP